MATLMGNLVVALVGQLLYSIFAPKPPDVEGPRLDSLNVPAVSPGNPINRVWGTMTVPGQLIWTSGLKETVHTKKVRGGKGGKSQKVTNYTYSASIAIAVCEGPAVRINRIKAAQKVLWESPEAGVVGPGDLAAYEAERRAYWTDYYASRPVVLGNDRHGDDRWRHPSTQSMIDRRVQADVALWKKKNGYDDAKYPEYGSIAVYLGTETQNPDPTMEAALGVGKVPAHRGIVYFVVNELQLADFGNTVPSFTVEVVRHDGGVSVHTIVKDLCEAADLVEGDTFEIGVELQSKTVHGFALTALTTCRAAIEMLQKVHHFEGVERGDRITFRTRDRGPVGGIRYIDMRTDDKIEGGDFRMERTRADDLQLPRRIEFEFQDVNRDYSRNKVHLARAFTQSNLVKSESLTIASTTDVIKRAVEVEMTEYYAARNTLRCFVPPKYLVFGPGDILKVETENGEWRTVRVSEVTLGANFVMEFQLQDYMGSEAGLFAVSDDRIVAPPVRSYSSEMETFILDTPSLDDSRASSGVYVMFGRGSGRWVGGGVFRDVGFRLYDFFTMQSPGYTTSWELEFTTTAGAAWGITSTALLPGEHHFVDRDSELIVQFMTPGTYFSSITLDDAANSLTNIFLVGDEIVQALEAEYLDTDLWKFTGLIRGIRGTDWAAYEHGPGDRVLHITEEALSESRWPLSESLIDKKIEYRAVVQGEDVLGVSTESFVYQGGYDRALAPDIINVQRDDSGNITFQMSPRAKYDGFWNNGAGTAATDPDNYRVEIWSDDPFGTGLEKLRSIVLAGSVNGTYTAAQQVTDFGAIQDTVHVRAVQVMASGRDGYTGYTIL